MQAISTDSPRNWVMSCRRLAPSTFLNATSRARWLARAVARLVKFTQAMPRIRKATIRKVVIVVQSLPGRAEPFCATPRWMSRTLAIR